MIGELGFYTRMHIFINFKKIITCRFSNAYFMNDKDVQGAIIDENSPIVK